MLTISNKDYLSALYQLVSTSSVNDEVIQLSEAQILMLNMSDDDIENEGVVSQETGQIGFGMAKKSIVRHKLPLSRDVKF